MTMAIATAIVATPAPTVNLTLTGLPAGTSSLIVTRSWASTVRTVRQRVVVSGTAALVRDYSVPIGRAASWTVQALSAAGAILESGTSGSVTVPLLTNASTAWVVDELDPRHAMLVSLMEGTDAQVQYSSNGILSVPADGGDATWISGARQIGGRPFIVKTTNAAQGDAFEVMIRRGSVLLFRCNPETIRHRHGLIIVAAADIIEFPRHPKEGPSTWQASGAESAPDAWPDTVPLVTWDERRATLVGGTTWASRKAASPIKTWLQRQQEQGN